jgi:hypothetical protein
VPECSSQRKEIAWEIAAIHEESLLKDLEEHAIVLHSTGAFVRPADKPRHARGPFLEALAELPDSKQSHSKEPQTSQLYDMKPPPYEGKSQKEFDDFVDTLETIFLLDSTYYSTERSRALYSCQYFKGTLKERWKQYARWMDPSELSWMTFKGLFQDHLSPLHQRKANLVRR